MATLLEKCNEIKNQKDLYIKPENLRKNITAFGVTGELEEGINTSDATAAAGDIAVGKTAYVNNEKVTGSIKTVADGDIWNMTARTTVDFMNNGALFKAITTFPDDILFRGGSRFNGMMASTDVAEASGLTSDILLKGHKVLGIEGAVEAGERASIKHFNSIEEMNNDTDKQVGDIGLVYTMGGPLDLNTEFSTFKIPKSVTLATEITEFLEFNFVSKDPEWIVENWQPCRLDSAYFEMSLMLYNETQGNMKHIMVEFYNDNGTYSDSGNTQGDITEDANYFYIELPCTVGFSEDTIWNDAFGKFMINTTATLEGLYAIESLESGYQLAPTQLTATSENLLPGSVAYGKEGLITGSEEIYNLLDKNIIHNKYLSLPTVHVPEGAFVEHDFNSIYNEQTFITSFSSDTLMFLEETEAVGSDGYIATISNIFNGTNYFSDILLENHTIQYMFASNDNQKYILLTKDKENSSANLYAMIVNADKEILNSQQLNVSGASNQEFENNVLVFTSSTNSSSSTYGACQVIAINMNTNSIDIIQDLAARTETNFTGYEIYKAFCGKYIGAVSATLIKYNSLSTAVAQYVTVSIYDIETGEVNTLLNNKIFYGLGQGNYYTPIIQFADTGASIYLCAFIGYYNKDTSAKNLYYRWKNNKVNNDWSVDFDSSSSSTWVSIKIGGEGMKTDYFATEDENWIYCYMSGIAIPKTLENKMFSIDNGYGYITRCTPDGKIFKSDKVYNLNKDSFVYDSTNQKVTFAADEIGTYLINTLSYWVDDIYAQRYFRTFASSFKDSSEWVSNGDSSIYTLDVKYYKKIVDSNLLYNYDNALITVKSGTMVFKNPLK